MKKLTLDQTWKLCLSMWRWIAKMWRKRTKFTVEELKKQWLEKRGYKADESYIIQNCFFCEYASQNGGCSLDCPGVLIDTDFDCNAVKYDYERHPIAFYNKLVSLNRKRLAKK